jgi:hypothetical protein
MRNSRPSVDQRMLTAEKRLPEKRQVEPSSEEVG